MANTKPKASKTANQKKRQGKNLLDDVPKMGTSTRQKLLRIFKAKGAWEIIKGADLNITEQDLNEIEDINGKYGKQDGREEGLCKTDIDALIKKYFSLSPNTIKLYTQKALLPRAIKRITTDKGSISLYPLNFFRHLIVVRLCLKLGCKVLDVVVSVLEPEKTDYDLLTLADISQGGEHSSHEEGCLFYFNVGLMEFGEGLGWTWDAIDEAFKGAPEKKNYYHKKLENFEKKYKTFVKDQDAFVAEFKENKAEINKPEDA